MEVAQSSGNVRTHSDRLLVALAFWKAMWRVDSLTVLWPILVQLICITVHRRSIVLIMPWESFIVR